MSIPFLLGLAVVVAYVYPATIAPLMGLPDFRLYIVVLPAVTLFALVGSRHGPHVRWSVAAFLLATSLAVLASGEISQSIGRWLGFALLVAVIGPLLHNPFIARLRDTTWRTAIAVVVLLTVASCGWWLLGAPTYGRGTVSGIWNHAMVLGPTAAVAAIWAYVRTIEWRSPWYGLLLAVCGFACILSASRAALLALALGIVVATVMLMRRRFYFLYAMLFGVLLLGSAAFVAVDSAERPLPDHVQERVIERGFATESRENLWKARYREFRSSPAVGVGFARQADRHDRETIEPGSSYLGLLAQTGIVGVLGFVVFGVAGIAAFVRHRRRLEPWDGALLVGLGVFFLAHQFFEGYLLAVGSILAFLFWLWAGVSLDRLRYPPARHALPPAHPRLPSPLPAVRRSRWPQR